jgi:tetratricopeptide (TPR) repeat protein
MDNENLLDEEEVTADEPDLLDEFDSAETKGKTLGWRIVLIIIALIVIAVLTYPFIRNRSAPSAANNVETQPTLTAPETTTQIDPNSAQAQFELGNSYVRSGEWPKAAEAFRKAIELDPGFQTAYANLGVVYYQQGQFDLAASQYEKALELNPNDREVAYNLGALYLQQALSGGEQPDTELLNQAIAQLENVNELAPDLAEPYFGLGVAYTILNRKEEAIQAFETFLARDTGQDPRASQEAQRYLQNLRGE